MKEVKKFEKTLNCLFERKKNGLTVVFNFFSRTNLKNRVIVYNYFVM